MTVRKSGHEWYVDNKILRQQLRSARTEVTTLRASAVAAEYRAIKAEAEVARLTALLPSAEEQEILTSVISQAWVYDRELAKKWIKRLDEGRPGLPKEPPLCQACWERSVGGSTSGKRCAWCAEYGAPLRDDPRDAKGGK
jgi:hypothetical protein